MKAGNIITRTNRRFFYPHIDCTKGLFHASCEIYHFAHPDIYTF